MSKEEAKDELIKVLECQVMDLSMMSKIELGDDVIEEIKRLKSIISDNGYKRIVKIEVGLIAPEDVVEYVKQIQEAFKKPIPLDFKLPENYTGDERN